MFLIVPLVTSQARAEQAMQNSAASEAQATPSPTPAELPQQSAAPSKPQSGNCHLIITSAPATQHAAKPGTESQPAKATAAAASARKVRLPISEETPVTIDADECEKAGDVYTLLRNVKIRFNGYDFGGDTVTYDSASGDVTAKGHVSLDGGRRDMHINGTEGSYNIHSQTGKFYNVRGGTGARFKGRSVTLTSSSPITFTGKVVEQLDPETYILHHGSVTSCELPHPKWTFNASKIILKVGDFAHIYNTSFRIKNVPVFYLPYASAPVERLGRQSGFLIPTFGTSNTKGTVIGDSFYWAINRSMDATLGGEYLSKRGWALQENFRYRPSDSSFLNLNYFGVLDRGITTTSVTPLGTITQTTKQGGEDVKLNAEKTFADGVRGVASIDYLSSFVFRLAFNETFSQAVDSEVKSTAFLTKSIQGFSFNTYLERYQNFQSSTVNNDVITILHTPGFETSGIDRPIFGSPIYWSYDVAAEGLRRSQPGFVTPGLVGRFDVAPDFSLPLFFGGWTFRPEVELRNTIYSQQENVVQLFPNTLHDTINRRTIAATVELRPPTLTKIFDGTIAGRKVKHTIEPRLIYRYTNGVENFASIIRFDYRDILSNTNEVELGLLQRLYLKREQSNCSEEARSSSTTASTQASSAKTPCTPAGADEFVTWEVKMKYFADPTFGGAVVNNRRNVLTTTDDFTGIAFLTDPRRFSPLVSQLRFRTTSNSDVEWQLDYDTKKGRIESSTLLVGYHFGDYTVGASHAYLQVPGEIVADPNNPAVILNPCIPHVLNQPACVPELFNQFRAQFGYGSPTKRGWSAAANMGFDREFNLLQYGAVQASHNWDCCGISVEYRRFSLGSVRNENQYRFAFTLANIGSFGNLKRQERIF